MNMLEKRGPTPFLTYYIICLIKVHKGVTIRNYIFQGGERMKFTKMHGIANDYVYVNCFEEEVSDKSEFAKMVSFRHTGIGSDGAIFICPSDEADCEMQMYNADGTRAEMCGNGIRCVAKYVYDNNIVDKTTMDIISMGAVKHVTLEVGPEEPNPVTGRKYAKRPDGLEAKLIKVDMGEPILMPDRIPVILNDNDSLCINKEIFVGDSTYRMTCVSMGNPHAVVFVNNVSDFPLEKIGPLFENHICFPNRTNTEFVKVNDRSNVTMRVWERGAAETLACGTGACATAVACILNGLTDDTVTVHLLGGDLVIKWDRQANRVYMTGPAVTVFEGDI